MKKISSSLEDYLEAIYIISQDNHVARVTDISKRLHVSRPSVTGALKTLSSMGMINYNPYSAVTLTPKGRTVGKELRNRHEAIHDFFTTILHIDTDKANEAACTIEHAVDTDILTHLVSLVDFFKTSRQISSKWESFQNKSKDSSHASQ